MTILDPVSGTGQTVLLDMPPTALSISPDGQHAAVGHDGRISYVNLATATLEKTFPVTETVFNLALSAANIYAFPLRDQWEAVRIVNLVTGTETLWNWIYAGSTGGRISPNGKYLYINATKRYDISQPLPSAFDVLSSNHTSQWFSQDGSRLFSGSGQAFRLSDVASQDLQYNGTLTTNGLAAVADSSVQQVTATVNSGSLNDFAINFFAQQYLASIGSISIPSFTVGANTYAGHGRYLFWNAAGNRLFALVQADPASGLLNDYAIYTVSLNGGCGTSLDSSTASISAAGGTFTASVIATAGCAWKATSGASWITISGNAFSAGPATVTYVVDPNPATSARSATITIDGKTLTITQAAGTQVQLSPLTGLTFRAADADYSKSLDRIVALSGSPSRLNIYDPVTGLNTPIPLPLPGNALAVAPSGIRAAVCHDGLVSIVNLQTALIEKSLSVTVNCHDVAYADNGYVYMSVTGGWGSSDSLNTATGAETHLDLYYAGTNFRLNATGDAVYTSNTGTSGQSVTRYGISSGPLNLDYASDVYPAHPAGYTVWFTADGRMVGDSGGVFHTGSTLATDFVYQGTLSGYAGTPGTIGTVAHSPTRHLFASVPAATDNTLYLNGDKYLVLSSRLTFPNITIGGVSAKSHGKFVFWDSTGTKAYVILQADPSAGFLNDYAVYTLYPDFSTGCAVTLGTNSGTAVGYADTGSVAVNAAPDCVWQVTSNAAWIQVDSGTLGVGQGDLSYSVLANGTTSPRTGTITVGDQTFTVTQSGHSLPPFYSGVFRSGFFWLQDVDGNRQFNSPPDRAFAFGGVPGDIPITGDWNGSGTTKVGVYRSSNGLFVLDYDGDGQFTAADRVYNLGVGTQAGDVPVVGDWNGDGKTKVGLFRQGFFWILDTNGNGAFEQGVDQTFAFGGIAGDVPVVGDWDGSGTSKIGLFRLGFYWILDSNGNGTLDNINGSGGDQAFAFGGMAGDVPVVGDWNGSGTSKAGVFRQGFFWVLDGNGNHTFDGTGVGQDLAFPFGGIAGDKPVVGKW